MQGLPRQKPEIDRKRLGALIVGAMIGGHALFYVVGRGFPMLWTCLLVFLGFQGGATPFILKDTRPVVLPPARQAAKSQ